MELWGMPSKLYGVPCVVEDAVYASTKRGQTTQTGAYIMSEGNVFLLARPGSIESPAAGGPSFSTVTLFFKEEFTVETLKDTLNRRTRTDVVDHFDVAMTAPVSGFWFRGVTDDTSSA